MYLVSLRPVSYTHLDVYKRQDLEDRRLKVSEIVKPVGVSHERVHYILTE